MSPRPYAARIPAQTLLRRMWEELGPTDPFTVVEQSLGFALNHYELQLERVASILNDASLAGRFIRSERLVQLSNGFSAQSQRFTTAHELGHFFLHPGENHFCDREPQHGALRPQCEAEADCFAAELLMPSKLVEAQFFKRFNGPIVGCGTHQLIWFEIAARKRVEPVRLVLRLALQEPLIRACEVASVTYYNGRLFKPLCDAFLVSKAAMGIRLLDLGLVQ